MRAIADRLEIHTAIDADVIGQILLFPPMPCLLDLRQRLVNERLTTKPRIYRHDQQRIDLLQIGLDMGNGSRRIDSQAHFYSQGFDFPEQVWNTVAQFY